jgi:hypothetical protein
MAPTRTEGQKHRPSFQQGRYIKLIMALSTTFLLLVLLHFVGLSAPQQTSIITELPAYSHLPPCAASAVSSAAVQFSNLWCSPITEPVSLASCICLTWDKSAAVSEEISDAVELCTGGGSSELTFALSVLTTYCAAASQHHITSQTTTASGSLMTTPNISGIRTSPVDTSFTSTYISSASTPSSVGDSTVSSTSTLQTSLIRTGSGGGGGLSSGDKIGIGFGVIGVIGVIAGVIGAYYNYLAVKRKREGEASENAGIELPSREYPSTLTTFKKGRND